MRKQIILHGNVIKKVFFKYTAILHALVFKTDPLLKLSRYT